MSPTQTCTGQTRLLLSHLVLYVSNSGDTEELLRCARYIKEHFLNVQVGCRP